MTVEIDVFSGRPNPRWVLTEVQRLQVDEMLQDLPSDAKVSTPGLGFRGFLILDGTKRIAVNSGTISIEDQGCAQTYVDAKGLETYLRELAREQGYGSLIGKTTNPAR